MSGVSGLDIILLIFIGASAVGGLRRGFIYGSLDLIVFVVSILVGLKFAPWFADSLRLRGFPDPLNGAMAVFITSVTSYAVLGLAVRILISPLGALQTGTLGWFNSILGLIPGALRGTAMAALIAYLFLALPATFGATHLTSESTFARPLAAAGADLVRAGLQLANVDPAGLGLSPNLFGPSPQS
jgi:uncharacterized membrane protein required for colicin V production